MDNQSRRPEYEIPNLQVQDHAEQIADAAIFLYDHIAEINCVPSVMLESALALELYLKSLNARTVYHPLDGISGFQLTASPTTRSHFLGALFDAIDQPIQDELQQAYESSPVISGVRELRAALDRYSDLFVSSRYAFERRDGGGLNITDLVNLVRFFRQHVAAMPRRYRFG